MKMKITKGALTTTIIITIKIKSNHGNKTRNNKQKNDTKIDKIVTKQIHLSPEKQAVPIIHKVEYIGIIKSANFNIIKMVKLRHCLHY